MFVRNRSYIYFGVELFICEVFENDMCSVLVVLFNLGRSNKAPFEISDWYMRPAETI